MWAFASPREGRRLHIHTTPFLQAICDPVRVRSIQNRLAQPLTPLASLMIDPRVVTSVGIHPYGDGDLLAGPAVGGARLVGALETTHDVRIVVSRVICVVVVAVERKLEVMLLK